MSAKEMFEKLGYELTKENYCRIKYCNHDTNRSISFKKFNETIAIYPSTTNLSTLLLKAINKQIEELGWESE